MTGERGLLQKAWKAQRRPQKYGAVAVVTEEGRFASQREYRHWCVTKLRERAGEIRDPKRQVPFSLDINGIHICDYIADEVFFEGGKRVVVDVKGVKTPEFKLKAKLMMALLNIEVRCE